MTLKERYKRFLEWQREPFRYENHNAGKIQHCANCGTEFSDNFCPRCGQKAGVGKVSWQTVRQGIMLLWGVDSRSLPYTVMQLFLRPGHLISEYISGRRQVSFPPVKMLFLVAVLMLVIENLFIHEAPESAKSKYDYIDIVVDWFAANPGWGMIIISVILMLPTWIVFHRSPRHTHHTLPESFFIQVFMSTIIIVVVIITDILNFVPFIGWVSLVIPIYFIVVYKHLFGYGWWGTLWRLSVCLVLVLLALFILTVFVNVPIDADANGRLAYGLTAALWLLMVVVILALTSWINRRTEKKSV